MDFTSKLKNHFSFNNLYVRREVLKNNIDTVLDVIHSTDVKNRNYIVLKQAHDLLEFYQKHQRITDREIADFEQLSFPFGGV